MLQKLKRWDREINFLFGNHLPTLLQLQIYHRNDTYTYMSKKDIKAETKIYIRSYLFQ